MPKSFSHHKTIENPVSAEWQPPDESRLLSKVEVMELTGKSFPTIWSWMIAGKFPRAVVCGGQSMWHAHEVAQWIRSLPRRRLKGDADV